MNVSQFTKTVKEMSQAQKTYFKERNQSNLINAKELERTVDKALEDGIVFDLDIETNVPMQGDLFMEEDVDEETLDG